MSTLKVNTLEEATAGGATYFTAKAWVNFNGQGTVAIRDDGNVSSITDSGTGNYGVNLTNTLSSSNYSSVLGGTRTDSTTSIDGFRKTHTYATFSFRISTVDTGTGLNDHAIISAGVLI